MITKYLNRYAHPLPEGHVDLHTRLRIAYLGNTRLDGANYRTPKRYATRNSTDVTRYTLRRCPLHPKNLSRRAVPEKSDYHVFFALHATQCNYLEYGIQQAQQNARRNLLSRVSRSRRAVRHSRNSGTDCTCTCTMTVHGTCTHVHLEPVQVLRVFSGVAH